MPIIGVYHIQNLENGKLYVGSSVEVEKRFDRHRRELKKGVHHCIPLQRAWNKYGEEAFEFRIDKFCNNEFEARLIEQDQLDSLDKLYNTSQIVGGGDLISYHPNREQIVRKIKVSLEKRYNSMTPDERRDVYGSHVNGMTGRSHSIESRMKMSKASIGNSYAKGAVRTPEHRSKLSEIASQRKGEKNSFYGREHSEETKKKLSRKMKGVLPPNTRPVLVDGIIYESCSEAARQLGVVTATILNRLKSPNFPTYKYFET
ncbi:NUMOD3 domain-containing DNA-binding protein [Bacillus sp. JJ1533]|uniref:NUMOD3 domain-containing DNA-binding protein n=1 Tax=Bacillus sp. JJ1533 TaxID=3122959 RepID=UPI002FFDB4A0